MKDNAEREHDEKEKEFKIEQSRRKKARTTKKPLNIAGNETVATPYAGPESKLFDGLTFFVMTDQVHLVKKSKAELETMVKANGGKLVQRDSTDKKLVIVADKRLVKVSSLEKRNTNNIVKPIWISDCIRQADADAGAMPYILPFEPNRHMFHLLDDDQMDFEANVDENGDSYARDIENVDEMRRILSSMPKKFEGEGNFDRENFLTQLEDHGEALSNLKNCMFNNIKVYFPPSEDAAWELSATLAKNYVEFAGGVVLKNQKGATHVVVPDGQDKHTQNGDVDVKGLARTVGAGWIEKCWQEGTRVDEERFQRG